MMKKTSKSNKRHPNDISYVSMVCMCWGLAGPKTENVDFSLVVQCFFDVQMEGDKFKILPRVGFGTPGEVLSKIYFT